MSTQILMPALSPTMTEGKLAKWLKKVGEDIRAGDVIAEIETDKATMEVEAVDDGTLAKILVPEGTQDVAVNDIIAVLAGEGAELLTLVRLTDAAGQASIQRRPQFLEQTMLGHGTHSSAQATRTTLSSPISGPRAVSTREVLRNAAASH